MATAEDLLSAVKQLSPDELLKFSQQFLSWQKQNDKSGTLPSQSEEQALLAIIKKNSRLPSEEQEQFDRLRRKRQVETLTKSEAAELAALWKRVEQMNVARTEALAKLAQRRGTDIRTLMGELGIALNHDVF